MILRQPFHAEHVKRGIEILDSAQMPPEEKLRAIIRARIEGLRAADLRQWQFRIMAREMASPTPAFVRVLDQVAGHRTLRNRTSRYEPLDSRRVGNPSSFLRTLCCLLIFVSSWDCN